ncbi:MAG: hypothetical protein K8R23_16785 [Chthoniobacter sp.]|nr:hypothetical protein [Chthoniobacter sp.]
MSDHFAALSQPRRPWLDPAALRESFHRAAAVAHPDAGGDATIFAALNAAQAVLGEPASRLRHLIELEAPQLLTRAAPVPGEVADLFMQLATVRRAAEDYRKKHAATSSPLARALLAGEKAGVRVKLDAAIARLAIAQEQALAEVRALDATWATPAWEPLAALQARLAFLSKWSGQLREDLFQLGP